MRILIVRHADPDYEHDSITEKGRREAELLATRLSAIPATAYYVSPMGRAKETAAYTLEKMQRDATVLPWLAEFRGFTVDHKTGKLRIPWDFRTTTWASHPLLFDRNKWTEDPLMQGGDVADIWRETKEGIDALLAMHGYIRNDCVYHCENNSDDTLVLFCHYAIGMAALAYLTNMPPVPMWHSFLFPTSSVTTLITQERTRGEIEFRCISAGDISHLLQGNEQCSLRGLFPEIYNGVESTDPSIWPYTSPIPVIR